MDTDGVRNGRRAAADRPVDARRRGAARASRERLAPDVRAVPARARSAPATTASSARTCISRHHDGALLLELFTRDGVGTMIASTALAHLRNATIDDVGGILAIIEPLEEQGVLVRRSRERLEAEIERFVVAEYDNHIIGCAALYAFPEERVGELAALAVHPDFRREGYGEALMQRDRAARAQAQARRRCSC